MDRVTIEIPKDFLDLYPYAKKSILFYEAHEGRMAFSAITELRDCLDHMTQGFQEPLGSEKQRSEFSSALEHLRRASIEPLELAVENRVDKALSRYKWALMSKIFLVSRPSQHAIYDLVYDIRTKVYEGRKCKNMKHWKKGLEHFEGAYKLSRHLEKILPEKEIILSRLFALAIAIASFLLGLFVS